MAYVSSLFARRMIEAAGPAVDPAAFLRSVALDPSAPLDLRHVIPAEAYLELLERLARAMPDGHTLPLRAGPLIRPEDYGALGLAWKAAPTVRHVLARAERYSQLWTDDLAYELRPTESGAEFRLHRHVDRRLAVRLSNEGAFATTVSILRQIATPTLRPTAVHLVHPAPSSGPSSASSTGPSPGATADHERYFGCPVQFSAERDALVFSDETLGIACRVGDAAIHRFLLSQADGELESLPAAPTLESDVRRALGAALSEGPPPMRDVASALSMSERTLQRRLAAEGLTFKALVDSTRETLACTLLRQSRYPTSEVAFLTGFSDQSAFQRAFKRWTGETPMTFRERHA